jgi:hypothetical protein
MTNRIKTEEQEYTELAQEFLDLFAASGEKNHLKKVPPEFEAMLTQGCDHATIILSKAVFCALPYAGADLAMEYVLSCGQNSRKPLAAACQELADIMDKKAKQQAQAEQN